MTTAVDTSTAAPADASRHLGLRLLAAFIVGFVGLSLEIAYTRVISFKIFYYYTYFVIGLALLGLGAASSALALSSRLRQVETLRLVRVRVADRRAGRCDLLRRGRTDRHRHEPDLGRHAE